VEQCSRGNSLGSKPPVGLGEGETSPLLGGVSVTDGGEEESRKPLDVSEKKKGKIGWTWRLLKAQGVEGRDETETLDGNSRKERRRRRGEIMKENRLSYYFNFRKEC